MPSEREDEEMVAALIDAAGDAATALAYDADTVAMEAAVQKATDALVDRLAQYRARVARLEGALERVVRHAATMRHAYESAAESGKDEYRRGQIRGAGDAANIARAALDAKGVEGV